MKNSITTEYVIGVDMGTQGVRCLAVTGDGTILARASLPLPSHASMHGPNGHFEQDAEVWWQITSGALRQISTQLKAAAIAPEAGIALCISGTSGTIVPLDRTHHPLRPALMYSDGRATDEVPSCNTVLANLTQRLGYQFNASFALPRLLWLSKHEPSTWSQTALFAHQADYLVGKLTDIWGVSDFMNTLKTGYDVLNDRYPPEIEQKLGIPLARLPRVVAPGTPIGTLLPHIANELGLSRKLLVVAGMTDGCASQFAAGATKAGEWVSSLGTTLTIKGVSTDLLKDPQGRVYCHRHPEQGWLPGGASNTGGEVLAQRFANADLAAYDQRTARLAPTSLVSYPLVRRGERFPFVAPHAEGFMIDKQNTIQTQPDLAYIAALEGVALLERLSYEVVHDLGAPVIGPIRTVGGATRSQLWLRIRASVCNRPFIIPAVSDPAMGTAILAAASRLHADTQQATQAMVHTMTEIMPNSTWVSAYEETYAFFKKELSMRGYLTIAESII